jgi:hypothetical protein
LKFTDDLMIVKVKVMLQLTVSQSVYLGVEPQLGIIPDVFFFVTVAVLSIWGALNCSSESGSELPYDWWFTANQSWRQAT